MTGGYAGAADRARGGGELRPKGKDIKEGGFDSSAPNASFNNEIGGKKDPGRVAETQFAKVNAKAGEVGKKETDSRDGQYDILKAEEEA